MFVDGRAPSRGELLEALEAYEQVLPAARAHHYSNLAYALLGEVVARVGCVPYRQFVEARIFAPLALEQTSWEAAASCARGYLVEEYAGTVVRPGEHRAGRRRADGAALVDGGRPLPGGSGIGAAVLTNAGTRLATRELCVELAGAAIERLPAEIAPWRPEPEPPPELRAILGRWWSEGNEFVFSWRGGKLTAALPGTPPWVHPSVFEPVGDGSYRLSAGRERGGRLRIEGERLIFGGYPCTRTQLASP